MKFFLILFFSLSCALSPVQAKKYKRSHWPHWSDLDRDCLNTRHEILSARSLVPVTLNKKGCSVVMGRWEDYYFPEVHTLSKKVDIDHLVPLKHAHISGAAKWSRKEKKAFANDPENLVITNRSYNREKGAKGIHEWLPVHKSYTCKYIQDWVKIKKKYQLRLSKDEQATIASSNCSI